MLTALKHDLLSLVRKLWVFFVITFALVAILPLVELIDNNSLTGFWWFAQITWSIAFLTIAFVFCAVFIHRSVAGRDHTFNFTLPISTPTMLSSKLFSTWICFAVTLGSIILSYYLIFVVILNTDLSIIKEGYRIVIEENPELRDMTHGLIPVIVISLLLESVTFLFAVVLCNLPYFSGKSKNFFIALLIAYGIQQAIGMISLSVSLAVKGNNLSGFYSSQVQIVVSSVFLVAFYIASVWLSEKRKSV